MLDFLVIGAARCGSTWIHEALKSHPEVMMPTHKKELHFFNVEENFNKGFDWYLSNFNDVAGMHVVGEVTPSYLSDIKSTSRIWEHLPQVKLIASLRNPTERAFSSYKGHVMSGRLSREDTIFEAENKLSFSNQSSILKHGHYADHLKRFYSYFPKENILVLFYDDLRAEPLNFIQKIYDFIGVEDSHVPPSLNDVINEGRYSSLLRSVNVVSSLLPDRIEDKVRRLAQPAGNSLPNKLESSEFSLR